MTRHRFSIATFNVKNLVNAETDYYPDKDGNWKRYSTAQFEAKITWLARQLTLMDADYVFLQEVFHREALEELNRAYSDMVAANGLAQAPYVEVLHVPNDRAKDDNPQPGLALLGRTRALSHRKVQQLAQPVEVSEEFGLAYRLEALSRPLSIVEVDLGGGQSGVVLNLHLKSKRPLLKRGSPAEDEANLLFLDRAKGAMGSLVLRAGEALAVRREILLLAKGTTTPVFVVGDFNDAEGAVTTDITRGERPYWKLDDDIKKSFFDVELQSAAQIHLRRSEQGDFTTHVFNGHHGTIDHIFFSQEFYHRNPDRLGDLDYVRAFNDHLVDRDVQRAPGDRAASDHGQVVAYFSFERPAP